MMPNLKPLIPLLSRQANKPVPPAVYALSDEILARYGSAVQAVLFYGSCFRAGDAGEGLVDLYLLVGDYRAAYRKPLPALINTLLPPNVYYLEIPFEDRRIRAKYTVLSLADFQRGASMRWFHSYVWGRFAQPTGLLYARNDQIAQGVYVALAQAVVTFITRVLPAIPAQFDARELWRRGLLLSYQSELRSERPEKLIRLFEAASEHYEQITRKAMSFVPFCVDVAAGTVPVQYQAHIPNRIRNFTRLTWSIRRLQGKLLSLLRLFKALFTFKGGIDYVLWKIERHSGIGVELTPRLKKFPLVGLGVVFWRLYRRGAFR